MEIDNEFGKEVEKDMENEEISDEETKIYLNEENQDIIDGYNKKSGVPELRSTVGVL